MKEFVVRSMQTIVLVTNVKIMQHVLTKLAHMSANVLEDFLVNTAKPRYLIVPHQVRVYKLVIL